MRLLQFLQPAAHTPRLPAEKVDPTYQKLRLQVFLGIFIGYAGYYLVRKNFSMVMPDLIEMGYSKTELGVALSAISISYGISKFAMGIVSDRSNARAFLALGLLLSAATTIAMGVFPFATSSIAIMFCLLFLNGWFQGMGWPPCGRVVVHWFSLKERGTKMSIWNVSHNVGGGLMAPLAVAGLVVFGTWQGKFLLPGIVAAIVAFIVYLMVRDTPQSCGLPPVEEYKNVYAKDYTAAHEEELSVK